MSANRYGNLGSLHEGVAPTTTTTTDIKPSILSCMEFTLEAMTVSRHRRTEVLPWI